MWFPRRLRAITLAVALLCSTAGCSLVGLAIDLRGFPPLEVSHPTDQTLDRLPRGAMLRVHDVDGRAHVGVNLGVEDVPLREWTARFTAARDTNPALALLPAVGDSVLVLQSGFWRTQARFQRLLPEGIAISDHDGGRARELGYGDITEVQWQGQRMRPAELRSLAESGHLPSRRQLRLATESDTLLLGADQIARWKMMRAPVRVPWGFFAGLGLDYLGVLFLYAVYHGFGS